ncbi:MAG: hypothetical protein IH884_09930, partial [Myxococcales bacterium]|nr:hypothetical protein [Myxococcales bacterium]
SSTSEGIAVIDTLNVSHGERLFIQILGSGVSTGQYSLTLEGPELIDDVATFFRWNLAQSLEIVDFLGTGIFEGSIEFTGDTDIFAFTTPGYDLASATVMRLTDTFDPFVRVYEVSEDPAGNAILLQIGFNDDISESNPDAMVAFPITGPDRTSLLTGNTYNTYYVIVSGSNPDTDRGDYRLILRTEPTDDHPDVGEGVGHYRSPSKLARRQRSCRGCDIMTSKTRTRPAPGEHEATDSARDSVRVAVLQRMPGIPAVLVSNVDELLNQR